MTKILLSIGHGFSARALARRLLPEGWRVLATTRSVAKSEELRAEGVEPLIWPGSELPVFEVSHILSSVPARNGEDPVLTAVGESLRTASQLEWVGYLSTTGVYGDHGGAWVDESTPLSPATSRGQLRVWAESEWAKLGLPLHIFRLAGIYGPGRGPFEKVRRGTARRIIKEGQVFSRCHVDDIAQVIKASIEKPRPGGIYNICDDDPAPPQDVIEYAAQLLRLPIPPSVPFEEAEMTEMARSFYAESKKVRNDLIKEELGVSLLYPNYKDGLKALLAEEGGQDQK